MMAMEDLTFNYTVRTEKYISKVQHNPADLIYMNRNQIFEKDKSVIDAYGPVWIVGFCDAPKDSISIHNKGEFFPLNGKTGFFAPAFSIIQWSINAGVYNWDACVSHLQLPSEIDTKPFVFAWSGELPKTFADLIQLLKNSPKKIFFEQQNKNSSVAEKVKNYIDQFYTEDIHISEIAMNFHFSWAFMSREFKKVYGISPIEYRHRLRLFHAIKLLSTGTPAAEACFNSGFNSLTQFNTHFKHYFATSPSSYSSRKAKANSLKSL